VRLIGGLNGAKSGGGSVGGCEVGANESSQRSGQYIDYKKTDILEMSAEHERKSQSVNRSLWWA
jgi:hypothetical protein